MPMEDCFGNLKVGDRFFIPLLNVTYVKTSKMFAMEEITHRVCLFDSTQYVVRC